MDKAHGELQSNDGPIEFLHKRSTFYELAAILVEGGLNIVREETDILEESGEKILTDLTEIRHWLQGRIQDMRRLIVEKDNELIDSSENLMKLREAIELKERELSDVNENLEPGNIESEGFLSKDKSIHDVSAELDITKWKNTVDLQVSNIKQKLENEKKNLTSEMIIRKRQSRLSSPNLSFEFLEKERNEGSDLTEQDSSVIDRFSKIRTKTDESSNNQNVLIGRMSSDIDILKETLDLAFGKMRNAGAIPLEKQWRCDVEKDIEMILMKGFISNPQHCSNVESIHNLLTEDLYKVFLRDLVETRKSEQEDCNTESLIREDIYQFVVTQAVKDFHLHHTLESNALKQLNFQERTPRSRRFNGDHLQGMTPRSRRLDPDSSQECTPRSRMLSPRCKKSDVEGDEGLIQKLDSLLRCLEAEEDLMLSASSEIKERSANNNLVISSCEETDERDAIEWLITDDESMFSSVSEKLERALQQLYTSKDLLVELEESLEVTEDSGENDYYPESNDRAVSPEDSALSMIMQFQQLLGNVEHALHENLKNNSGRGIEASARFTRQTRSFDED